MTKMKNGSERIWTEPGMPGYVDKPSETYTVQYIRADLADFERRVLSMPEGGER